MFGSAILDVAIGLVFVFLIMSLIVTAVSELIASALSWRAANLEEGILNLFRPSPTGGESKAEEIAKEIYDHPLVNSLSKPGGKPSYIPSRTFALSMLDSIASVYKVAPIAKADVTAFIASIPDGHIKTALTALAEEAENDVEKLKTNVEVWFNNAMDRVSGWYKRRTQVVHVILGVIFAFALNVDTLLVGKTLADDSALRSSLVAQAQVLATDKTQPASDASKDIQERIKQLGGLGLPIGWTDQPVEGLRQWPGLLPGTKELAKWQKEVNIGWGELWGETFRSHIIGWLLTAFAASLGAPFWFDLLNKFMNLRSVGKAPEEKPKAPKEVPQPKEPGAPPGPH